MVGRTVAYNLSRLASAIKRADTAAGFWNRTSFLMSVALRTIVLGLVLALVACESKPPARPGSPAPTAQTPPAGDAPAAAYFAAVRTATGGNPEVIGSYTRGCISGAAQLGEEGPHWQAAHWSRNREWGHPSLIRFVRELSDKVAADGYGGLIVGDLAQPRGGPLPSSHTSHQVGLDADIWLQPMTRRLSSAERESYDPPSLVNFDSLRVTSGFGDAQYAIIMHAAESPLVERIFVSPPIKREMCDRAPAGDRAWLRKVRPWTGHASHMHVRIACPIDSDDCKAQDEPPEGDGCGTELQSWFGDRSWMRPETGTFAPKVPMKLDALPPACVRVLNARG